MDASKIKIVRVVGQTQESVVKGRIFDPNGAVIPGARLSFYKKNEKKSVKITSNEYGEYLFGNLQDGIYTLEIKSDGFKTSKINNLKVGSGEQISFDVELEPANTTVTVGIYAEKSLIDKGSSSVTTTISREMIDRLPH